MFDKVSKRTTFDLYTIGVDDGGHPGPLKRITTDPGQDSHAQYSPCGKWIVYTSERAGITDEERLVQTVLFIPQMYGEIFAYRLSDGVFIRLTHNKWEDGIPTWVGRVSR